MEGHDAVHIRLLEIIHGCPELVGKTAHIRRYDIDALSIEVLRNGLQKRPERLTPFGHRIVVQSEIERKQTDPWVSFHHTDFTCNLSGYGRAPARPI